MPISELQVDVARSVSSEESESDPEEGPGPTPEIWVQSDATQASNCPPTISLEPFKNSTHVPVSEQIFSHYETKPEYNSFQNLKLYKIFYERVIEKVLNFHSKSSKFKNYLLLDYEIAFLPDHAAGQQNLILVMFCYLKQKQVEILRKCRIKINSTRSMKMSKLSVSQEKIVKFTVNWNLNRNSKCAGCWSKKFNNFSLISGIEELKLPDEIFQPEKLANLADSDNFNSHLPGLPGLTSLPGMPWSSAGTNQNVTTDSDLSADFCLNAHLYSENTSFDSSFSSSASTNDSNQTFTPISKEEKVKKYLQKLVKKENKNFRQIFKNVTGLGVCAFWGDLKIWDLPSREKAKNFLKKWQNLGKSGGNGIYFWGFSFTWEFLNFFF